MNDTLTLQNDLIHREADEVLYSRGLFRLLSEYGTVHLTGSYSMNLMTWRDLDIYLESPALSLPDWFTLGGKIAFLLQPARMHFRNELIGRTEGLPQGYYWGIHLNPGQETAWKNFEITWQIAKDRGIACINPHGTTNSIICSTAVFLPRASVNIFITMTIILNSLSER